MPLSVVSAGFGRTGTMSLMLALEQLGFGPCHHMDEVVANGATQVPLWNDAVGGAPDFEAIYAGYASAVDWPTAAFWRELADAYPQARFVLSSRSPDSWVRSFSETILTVLQDRDHWPPPAREWLEMVTRVVIDRSLNGATDAAGLLAAFEAHEAAVKETIPPDRLLVPRAGDGWGPLCAFLEVRCRRRLTRARTARKSSSS